MREFSFHLYSKCHPRKEIGAEGFDSIALLHNQLERLLADPAVTDVVIVDVRERLIQTCRGVSWAFDSMLMVKYSGDGGLRECEIYTPPQQTDVPINRTHSEAQSLPPAA
jgi:hypothetical protein